MLLGTLGASLLGNLLTGKVNIRAGDGTVRAGEGSKKKTPKFTITKRGGLLSMLLGTLGASLLGNLLTGKGIIRAGDGIVRAGEESKKKT